MIDNTRQDDSSPATESGLLEVLANALGASPQYQVWGLNIAPLLQRVDSLLCERLAKRHMSETHAAVGEVINAIEPLVTAFVVANGKSPTAIGRWLVYGKCVEYVGMTMVDMIENYKETTCKG